MIKSLITIFFIFFTILLFAQNISQVDKQKMIADKGLQTMDFLKIYIKKHDLYSSVEAVRLIDTMQQLIKDINKDSLKGITQESYESLFNKLLPLLKEKNYKMLLEKENKSPKVRAIIENGEVVYLSKNTFMVLYTGIRIIQKIFNDWAASLQS